MAPGDSLAWDIIQHEKDLEIYRSGRNVKVLLRRPRNGNALTATMVSQLTDTFRHLARDHTVSRIIITAEGKFFCTGMDLGKSSTPVGKSDSKTLEEFQKFTQLFRAIEEAPQVTIAAMNGPCYAGGIGLAFACDIRLAVSSATVTLSEVKLGLCPAIISKFLIREWGVALTREAMLTGRTIPVSELAVIKAVHGLAKDQSGLDDLLEELLKDLARCAPGASTMCKSVISAGWKHGGHPDQDKAIEKVFGAMMRPDAESAVGIKGFQSGKRFVDWDNLNQGKASRL